MTSRLLIVFSIAASLLLAAFASAYAAGTPPVVTDRAGGWTAFMGKIDEGSAACGISNALFGNENRLFMVKWFYGNPYLTVQLSKKNWRIPRNASGDVAITFDSAEPFTATAMAHPSGDILEFQVPIKLVDSFLEEFREANGMVVTFRSGNEPAWTANLGGSRAIGVAFERCVKTYLARIKQQQGTQPYASQPTQPYSSNTQPVQPEQTQPFGSERFEPDRPRKPTGQPI